MVTWSPHAAKNNMADKTVSSFLSMAKAAVFKLFRQVSSCEWSVIAEPIYQDLRPQFKYNYLTRRIKNPWIVDKWNDWLVYYDDFYPVYRRPYV